MKNEQIKIFFNEMFQRDDSGILSKKIKELLHKYSKRKKISDSYSGLQFEKLFPFQSIPKHSYSINNYISELKNGILPYNTNVAFPKFIGHMTSALPNFMPEIAYLISKLNQNVVKIETSNSVTYTERQTIAMLHELMFNKQKAFYKEHVHHKNSTLGIITSGGTLANVTALQCARNKAFPNSEIKGVNSQQKGVVMCSRLGHYSIKKAMGLLGLGSENLITIPTDNNHKIDVNILKQVIKSCQREQVRIIAIIGVAGTTECGSIDPLETLATIASIHNIYFHVDAAWGGAIQFSDTYSHLLKGIEKADSITIDGHKQLYLPMGIGGVLFKDEKTAILIEKQSEYIIRKTSPDLGKRSIEGSRPAHSLYLHASLKLLGKQKYAALIEKGIENALSMANYIDQLNDFELVTHPETNIFLYRYLPLAFRNKQLTKEDNVEINNFNKKLQKKQKEAGVSFVSYTTIISPKHNEQAIVGLRVVLANPLTNMGHFIEVIKEQRSLAKNVYEIGS